MSKNAKILIAIVLVIIVIVICCITFGKCKNKDISDNNENIINNVIENNSIVENEINNNNITNQLVEEEEPVIENITEIKPQGTVYESNSDTGTTDKKQQAIALVEEKWGEDNTVTFRCDSVSSDGEYIIAVISKQTASVKNYFKVNLSTKTVEVDY